MIKALYETHGEKVRYLVVGVGNTIVGYGLFVALLAILGVPLRALSGSAAGPLDWLGRHYYLAVQWAAWVLMVPISTTTLKDLAFRSGGRWLPQVGRAYLVYAPAQVVSSATLWLAVQVMRLSPQVGQLFAVAFATVLSYLGHKYFTFREPGEPGPEPERQPEPEPSPRPRPEPQPSPEPTE
jgi:putative flippase GtrA